MITALIGGLGILFTVLLILVGINVFFGAGGFIVGKCLPIIKYGLIGGFAGFVLSNCSEKGMITGLIIGALWGAVVIVKKIIAKFA